jgi:hypothetical protein
LCCDVVWYPSVLGQQQQWAAGFRHATLLMARIRIFFLMSCTGDTVDRLTATVVKGLSSAAILVACGSRHTCVKLRGSNRVLCFGLNDFGQSSQTTAASNVPQTDLKFIDNPGKEGFSSTLGSFVCSTILHRFAALDYALRCTFAPSQCCCLYQVLASSTLACTLDKLWRFGASCTPITEVNWFCIFKLLSSS